MVPGRERGQLPPDLQCNCRRAPHRRLRIARTTAEPCWGLRAQAVRFALEVARGMDYIASLKMVHRDLAARNVLLSAKLECKITDFGLARDVYEGDGQYIANAGYKESNPTAWKWTSLEGLRQSTYTIEGDVWSYGILLSEISSLGDMPYADVRQFSNNFLDFLKGGGK